MKKILFLMLLASVPFTVYGTPEPVFGGERGFSRTKGGFTAQQEAVRRAYNAVQQTERFGTWWAKTGVQEAEPEPVGPDGVDFGEHWEADSSTGDHSLVFHATAGDSNFTLHDRQVFALKVKPPAPGASFALSLYDETAGLYHRVWFSWDGSVWTTGPAEHVQTFGITPQPYGWYRATISVEGGADTGNNPIFPGIFVAPSGASSAGLYLSEAQLEYGVTNPGPYVANGDRTFPFRVVRRGKPNDFWYNHTFLMDQPNGLGSGDCGTLVDDPAHSAFWFAADDQMDLERAWGIETQGTGTVLMDIEVATPHPDLAANIYTNPGESPDGLDDDGNGMVDDIHGWDMVNWNNTTYFSEAEYDMFTVFTSSTPNQHGTQMASLLGAVGNNEPLNSPSYQGSVGVCWDLDILPIRIFYVSGDPDLANPHHSEQYKDFRGVQYAQWLNDNEGANFRVVSMSYERPARVLLDYCYENDMLPVTGAGNANQEGNIQAGTPSDTLCIVAAVHRDGKTGNFSGNQYTPATSSFDSTVSFCGYAGYDFYYDFSKGGYRDLTTETTPHIFTLGFAYNRHTDNVLHWCDNFVDEPSRADYAEQYGIIPSAGYTSGATAEIAGLAALIRQKYPQVSAYQTKKMIERGCVTDIYDGRNVDQCDSGDCAGKLGVGRVNAYRSLTLWGTVQDTVLSGTVFVSGDVLFKGVTQIQDGTVFLISPRDIYQEEIATGARPPQAQYLISGLNPPAPASDDKVEIYLSGTVIFTGTVQFQSYAEQPTDFDWGGIWDQNGNAVVGTPVVLNTKLGDY